MINEGMSRLEHQLLPMAKVAPVPIISVALSACKSLLFLVWNKIFLYNQATETIGVKSFTCDWLSCKRLLIELKNLIFVQIRDHLSAHMRLILWDSRCHKQHTVTNHWLTRAYIPVAEHCWQADQESKPGRHRRYLFVEGAVRRGSVCERWR